MAGAFVVAALAGVLVLVLYAGAAVLARHRAQSAADLGALAGAAAHAAGDVDGCARARALVAAQDGRPSLDRCTVDGADVVVRVSVTVALGALGVRRAEAAARAGPADAPG